MKFILFFTLLTLLISCSGTKSVYWCGDHACINDKEKEAYFKKTMIVEKKIVSKKNKNDLTKSEEIIKRAKANEKKIKKDKKLEQIRLKKELKEQAKRAKLEKKRLKEEEKKLARKNKKKLSKREKIKIIKHEKTTSLSTSLKNVEFEQIKDRIIKKNFIRPYPDINDIPN
jgi:IS5 family transposase